MAAVVSSLLLAVQIMQREDQHSSPHPRFVVGTSTNPTTANTRGGLRARVACASQGRNATPTPGCHDVICNAIMQHAMTWCHSRCHDANQCHDDVRRQCHQTMSKTSVMSVPWFHEHVMVSYAMLSCQMCAMELCTLSYHCAKHDVMSKPGRPVHAHDARCSDTMP